MIKWKKSDVIKAAEAVINQKQTQPIAPDRQAQLEKFRQVLSGNRPTNQNQ